MAAASLACLLLALALFALLTAAGAEHRRTVRSTNYKHCDDYLTGIVSEDVIVLDLMKIPPYQQTTPVDNIDNCLRNGKKLVGTLVVACDFSGPPSPTINAYNSLLQVVRCHSEGPCAAGLSVTVAQFCQRL